MYRRSLLASIAAGIVGITGCASVNNQNGDDNTVSPNRNEANNLSTSVQNDSDSPDAPFKHSGTLQTTFATNGDYPVDEDPSDGLPPSFSDPPDEPDVDPASFETLDVNGETVRLAPLNTVEAWYRRGDTRFVDARGLTQYERAHVYGAVLSTAQKESSGGGIVGWPTDDRVVTYCNCPHHLSALRAAGLQKAGYSNVFALDDGFGAWGDASHPMSGTVFNQDNPSSVSEWQLDGTVAAANAGAYAWASHGRQYEASPISSDGEYTLHLKFSDVDADTQIRISTPDYTLVQPVGELAKGVITG